MSDPMTNMEIEDILSSVRRLVSEEVHGDGPLKPKKQEGQAGRLVLTPALMVHGPKLSEEAREEAAEAGAEGESPLAEEAEVAEEAAAGIEADADAAEADALPEADAGPTDEVAPETAELAETEAEVEAQPDAPATAVAQDIHAEWMEDLEEAPVQDADFERAVSGADALDNPAGAQWPDEAPSAEDEDAPEGAADTEAEAAPQEEPAATAEDAAIEPPQDWDAPETAAEEALPDAPEGGWNLPDEAAQEAARAVFQAVPEEAPEESAEDAAEPAAESEEVEEAEEAPAEAGAGDQASEAEDDSAEDLTGAAAAGADSPVFTHDDDGLQSDAPAVFFREAASAPAHEPEGGWPEPQADAPAEGALTLAAEEGDLEKRIADLEAAVAHQPDDWELDEGDATYNPPPLVPFRHRGAAAAPEPAHDPAMPEQAAVTGSVGVPATPAFGTTRTARPEPEPEVQEDTGEFWNGGENETVLDEEALRELIGRIVREELQGTLGERITRNVRKLVRREIHRVLNSQDME